MVRNSLSLVGIGVGSYTLAHCADYVDETSVVLHALLSTAGGSLLLFLSVYLGGLSLHLTSTGKRTMHLSTTSQAKHQMESALLLDVVV